MHIKLRFKILFTFIIAIILLVLYSRYLGTSGLIVKEYNVIDKNIPENFYGLKIVHFSDLYYKSTTQKEDLDNIGKSINKTKPDIVIFTGDIFDTNIKYSTSDIKTLTNFFKSIDSSIEKIAIKGNNDLNNEAWESIINDSSFTNLNDDYMSIYYKGYEPIVIYGIGSNYKNNHIRDTLNILTKEVIDKYKFSILILHEPDYITSTNNKFNLILSSHSLNGQIVLPFIGGIIKDKGSRNYIDNFYDIDGTKLYISSGIGTNSKYKFRLFNRPSINLYRLRNK